MQEKIPKEKKSTPKKGKVSKKTEKSLKKAEINNTVKDSDLMIIRLFDAPRDLVYKYWTEPEKVKCWWGPKEFTAPFVQIDFRVGGKYLYCMRSPDGKDYWSTGMYRQIIPNEIIVATDNFADEKGNIVDGTHYGMSGDWSRPLIITMSFEDRAGKTKFTLVHEGFPNKEHRNQAQEGWSTSLDKLAECLTQACECDLYNNEV